MLCLKYDDYTTQAKKDIELFARLKDVCENIETQMLADGIKPERMGGKILTGYRNIDIIINELEELTWARHTVKKVFPDWKDKVTSIYATIFDDAVCVWNDKSHPEIAIRLVTKIKDFPEALMKDTCRFEKTVSKVESWSYTCDNN